MYKPSMKSSNGTMLVGTIRDVKFEQLCKIFGQPNGKPDNYKVTQEWIIEDEKGNIFVIYDWKLTKFYSEHYISVNELKKKNKVWDVSGNNEKEFANFVNFINSKK